MVINDHSAEGSSIRDRNGRVQIRLATSDLAIRRYEKFVVDVS